MLYVNKLEGVSLEVRQDGIYVILDNSVTKSKKLRDNPSVMIEGLDLYDPDLIALVNAFVEREPIVEVKISARTACKIVEESMTVEISRDCMQASVKFTAPGFFGRHLGIEEIIQQIKDAGVAYGVLTDVIQRFSMSKMYGHQYVIALGKQPVAGTDGTIKMHFDVNARNNHPTITHDGSVDYKSTNYFIRAEKKQVLAEIIPPLPGANGMNVLRQIVGYKPGKPAPRLPKGKNTYISEDNLRLLAETAGQIIVENNKVSVLPVLEIRSNVGFETGNVDFTGSVFVSGNVLNDFSIKATGDIEVRGVVEGATIESGGNVTLLGGIKGMGKGVISANGNIFTRFAERATLIANGDVTSDSIMHSDVKCKGAIVVEGKKGLLVGGSIVAGRSITARIIGSTMATETEITVGHSPDILDKYRELEAMYKKSKAEYDNEYLLDNYKAGGGDLRMRSMHVKIHLRAEMDRILKEMNELLLILNVNDGVIYVGNTLYTGVKVMVGGAFMKVTGEMYACSLRNVDGRVTIGTNITRK